MLYDILIPSRIGNYFLLKKRVLSIELNPTMIKAVLVEYAARSITVKNSQTIILKDFTTPSQTNALKKIVSNIGTYDELIIILPSNQVIYKELTLPFIGYDSLRMIVPFEVESLLPFIAQEAVIDFIITHENHEKRESQLLVAAIRSQDIQEYLAIFDKAEITVNTATIDVFSLYETFKHVQINQEKIKNPAPIPIKNSLISDVWKKIYTKTMPSKQETDAVVQPEPIIKNATLYINIGFDVTRVLYFQHTQLVAIRIMPTGISDIATHVANASSIPYFDIIQQIIHEQIKPDLEPLIIAELSNFYEEIKRTIMFFEKQHTSIFSYPTYIWFSGFLTTEPFFIHQAQEKISQHAQIYVIKNIIENLQIHHQTSQDHISIINMSAALFVYFNESINFIKKNDNALLNRQLISIICITMLSIGIVVWQSIHILDEKEHAYNTSKKQCIKEIEQRMHLDLQGEKNIKIIVEKTEEKLKKDTSLWLSFTKKQQHSLLEHLQDLSINIDREAIGLIIKTMHFDYDIITMNASVKSFEKLDILEEELMQLSTLQLVDKPRELTFTITFKPKITQGKKS